MKNSIMTESHAHLTFFVTWCLFQGFQHFGHVNAVKDDIIKCKPEDVHLAFGPTSQEVTVMWTTREECTSQVHYAAHPWHLNVTASGDGKEFGCPLKNSTKFIHRVVLKNLKPGSTVFYHPTGNHLAGSPFYFKVPDLTAPSHFVIFNDVVQEHWSHFAKSLEDEAYIHSFSSIFFLSEPHSLLVPKDGDNFFNQLKELAASHPLMIGAQWGAGTEAATKCGRHLFSMPNLKWPMDATTRWYSHDVGPLHIIRYSSQVFIEEDNTAAKAMQAWMLDDLTKVNKKREKTPWVVAMGLDPMYCGEGNHGQADCVRNDSKIRHGLEDVFFSSAVDLVIEQQDGPYERTWPHYKGVIVSNSYVEPAAPVEIIMGLGKTLPPPVKQTNSSEISTAEWTAIHLQKGGQSYGRLVVANASHLQWQLLSASDSTILDEIWIVQSRHGNFSLSSLPYNVSHQINQSIIAMGGKPGTYDFVGGLASDSESSQGESWSKYSLWLGLGLVGVAIAISLGVVTIRSYLKRRRGNSGRRWQEVDRHGSSGHFYSMASDSDSDDENENDFEIDMFERSAKSGSKLLTSY